MTEGVMRDIASMSGDHLRHLDAVWDARLERLYADCAFSVMPSVYEGFGLPVIESFAHGRPVIASTGGALPEVVNGLSPCLDPDDREGWTALVERWLLEPSALRQCEAHIRTSFHRRDWREVAAEFWRAATPTPVPD
jgi:glycosyltransferase involved in cell wall biosynthesis